MIQLDKSNIQSYLKDRMPDMDFSKPLIISAIGEGSEEEDGDGFLNYIFRVSDGRKKLVLKQSRSAGHKGGFTGLPEGRVVQEYETMAFRKAIVPEYIPDLYFCDSENNIIAEEDVSHLSILRFQLMKNVTFPKFAHQIADYMAKTLFYTSEYYMDAQTFREMTVHFINPIMRTIFEYTEFITQDRPDQDFALPIDDKYMAMARKTILDPRVVRERYKLKHIYDTHGEAFLHTDLHTSNILMDQREMKVIDMEYTFCGPLALDVGKVEASMLAQYVSAAFRPFPNEAERKQFRDYCLDTMVDVFNEFCQIFFACWDQSAKRQYQGVPGLKDDVRADLLKDTIGFTGTCNIARVASKFLFPEYAVITDAKAYEQMTFLSLILDQITLLNRAGYRNIEEWVSEIKRISDKFLATV